jgi:sec-independent protein translocase protein TatB
MFEVGFSELLLISVIALVVLGPERLPKLVGQVGRWVGKARSMARQFREQLESEVNLDELSKTPPRPSTQSSPSYPPPGEAPPNDPMSDSMATAHMTPAEPVVDPDTIHHPTSDYPYAEPGYAEPGHTEPASHPEADVYGGTTVAAPEYLTPEEPAAVEDKEAPVPLHDQRA